MFLTPADLARLTGRTRWSAQRRALDRLGIRYLTAGTGEPLVRPSDLDGGGEPVQRTAHRWDRIGGAGAHIATLARARR